MSDNRSRTALAAALVLTLVSLGCFSEETTPGGGSGGGGTGDVGDECSLLDLRAVELEVDTEGVVEIPDQPQMLDGTFELSWSLEYVAEDCDAPQPPVDFVEQVRVTRGAFLAPPVEDELQLDAGETLARSLSSSEFFATLGPGNYTAEVWLFDVPADSEHGDGDPTANNNGVGAPSISFQLPPA